MKRCLKGGQAGGAEPPRPVESGRNFLYRGDTRPTSGVQTLCGILRLHTSTGASSAHRTGGARTHIHTPGWRRLGDEEMHVGCISTAGSSDFISP